MFRNYTYLSLVGAIALTACSVVPENPQQYSQNQAVTYAQPVNASYQTAQSRAAEQDCRRRETNRELIGGAVGGAAGAYAGKKIVGGTKGVVGGAVLGGVVGYGIGDISTNCAPATQSNASYQSAPTYSATPANYEQLSCPAGTRPHPSGTCLLDDSNASLQSATFTGAPTPTLQQAQTAARTENLIIASRAPTAPSAYAGTEITRQYGVQQQQPAVQQYGVQQYGGTSAANYGGNYNVVSGDTVYSLSRKLCVPVSAIQSSNGLDSNYGIKIGQSLNLPASQC